MWMMGCSDGSGFNMADSFNGRKLRPLMPRLTTNSTNTATVMAPCLTRIHGTDFFALNTHLATVTEHSKREFSAQPVVSSRWNPTPEQLRTLEELYRCGTRTPTAEQIQHITAQLRRFGKIEGKNVFYWFQNHKARERQKRRRRSAASEEQQHYDTESLDKKESGSSRTGYEVEQTKNWAPPTNCSSLSEETVSMQRAAVAESRTDGWIQFEEGELQHRRTSVERNPTWQMMQLSSPPTTPLKNTITTATTEAITVVDPKLINNQNLELFKTPSREYLPADLLSNGEERKDQEECGESQTLQLFPLRSDSGNGGVGDEEKETEVPNPTTNSNFTTYQFFEFLPTKN
ncbi:PREDICTED: WUSCHEL-related homeobox 1-like [Nelumbo nucifera]|uniref:Homeobox domain-containing protein n=2 Tax=Nelumbo nucifera TaxID=4432 RepID=A0A822YS93_NELNU|nr:PREDICTED: WUSCHEL-related homeobox 1-like [Nelumbo nucifera]DAD32088.1 TPA_asm: hypothetical protein HUJ06_010939 [Nelumbo nucifera]